MTATITNLPNPAANPAPVRHTATRRADGEQETPADKRFFDLRDAGYEGPIDQDGHAVSTAAGPAGLDPESERDRRKATELVAGDLMVAARLLYVAVATTRRLAVDGNRADRIERVRADLVAVLADEDTPSEIEYGDLAADASAYCDEVHKLREELESAREPHNNKKGN